jgi:carboxyl-terminal processing protease
MTAAGAMRVIGCALALLGAPASAAPSQEAQSYFNAALTLLRDWHINSADADWVVIEAEARANLGDAQTPAETHEAIRLVIARVGERHTFLVVSPPTALAGSSATTASGPQPEPAMPAWKPLEGGIGYVSLPALNTVLRGPEVGERYRSILVEGLTKMDEAATCGWIIDLRTNGGGNMWPMLQGLDPLLGEEPFGRFLSNDGAVPWRRTRSGILNAPGDGDEVRPALALTNADAPVAVLIGPTTASSGEMVAIAFVGRKDARTFGAPSAGFTTANVPHVLSDGAVLAVTVSKVGDRTGRVYQGAMVPDEETGVEDAHSAAVAWLTKRCEA